MKKMPFFIAQNVCSILKR